MVKNYDRFEPVDTKKKTDRVYTPEDSLNRLLARGAEGALGLPGDIANAGLGIANWASEKTTGNKIPGVETAQKYLPTSHNVRKAGKYLFNNKFEPEQEDSFWEKVASDFGSYIVPIGQGVKLGTSATRALAGNAASEGAKAAGFGETGQAAAKLTTNILSMFPGSQRFFTKKAAASYDAAKAALPKGATVKVKDLERDLNEFAAKNVYKGDPSTEAKTFLKDRVNAVGSNISNDTISVDDATELIKDFNGLWRDKKVPSGAKHAFGELIEKLNNAVDQYGKTDPAFGENFQAARDIYKGMRTMDDVSRFIVKNTTLSKLIKKPQTASLLGGLAYFSPVSFGVKAATAGTAYTIGQGVKTANLIKNSKEAYKAYEDILKYAALKDVANTAKSINRFEKTANDYDKKFSRFEKV